MEKISGKGFRSITGLPALEQLLLAAVVGVGVFGLIYCLVYVYMLQSAIQIPKVIIVGSFGDIISIILLQAVLICAVLLHRILIKMK